MFLLNSVAQREISLPPVITFLLEHNIGWMQRGGGGSPIAVYVNANFQVFCVF